MLGRAWLGQPRQLGPCWWWERASAKARPLPCEGGRAGSHEFSKVTCKCRVTYALQS